LDEALVYCLFRQVTILPRYARVDGIIWFTGYDYPIPDAYLENAVPETMIPAGGILDEIIGWSAGAVSSCLTHVGCESIRLGSSKGILSEIIPHPVWIQIETLM